MTEPDEPTTTGPAGASGARGAHTAFRRWATIGGTALLLLVADQLSKRWAFGALCEVPSGHQCLEHAAPIELVWTLQLNLAFNTGMAFSRGAGAGPIIGSIAVLIVVVLLFVSRRVTSRLQLVLVGVVAGGALGNVVDRLTRAEDGIMSGAVVDFIDVQWWPIFNIADAAVVVGGIALALTGLGSDGPDRAGSPEDEVTTRERPPGTA
jgi:signal peptidase II